MSSSGLVLPSGRSVREAQVTGRSCAAPLLASSKVPEPFCRFSLHTTLARRSALAIHASNTSVSTDTKRAYPLLRRSNPPQWLTRSRCYEGRVSRLRPIFSHHGRERRPPRSCCDRLARPHPWSLCAALNNGAVEQERGLPQGGLQIERV